MLFTTRIKILSSSQVSSIIDIDMGEKKPLSQQLNSYLFHQSTFFCKLKLPGKPKNCFNMFSFKKQKEKKITPFNDISALEGVKHYLQSYGECPVKSTLASHQLHGISIY